MDFDQFKDSGKKILAIAAMVGLTSCSQTLARRDYDHYPAHQQEIAFYNLEHILYDLCCNDNIYFSDLNRSNYFSQNLPSRPTYLSEPALECDERFWINQTGFHCLQRSFGGLLVSHYNWDEILNVECTGSRIRIQGTFDSSVIITAKASTPQCRDLAEAFNIYLRR